MLVFVLLAATCQAQATLMKPLRADGRLWLQPFDFLSVGWDDVAALCAPGGGPCSGSLNGNDISGWSWATFEDMNDLFNFFVGDTVMGPGQSDFLERGPIETLSGYSFFEAGWLITANLYPGSQEVIGYVADYRGASAMGGYSRDFGALQFITGSIGAPEGTVGAWFYRAEVPLPGTLPLVGLVLLPLLYIRRRHCSAR
jgi:hypothetical protein